MNLKAEKLLVWGAALAVVQLVACEKNDLGVVAPAKDASRLKADSAYHDSTGKDSTGHGDTSWVPRPDTLKPRPDTIKPRPDTIKPRPDTVWNGPKPRPDSVWNGPKPRPDTIRPRPDTGWHQPKPRPDSSRGDSARRYRLRK